jgi:hypothetical protein
VVVVIPPTSFEAPGRFGCAGGTPGETCPEGVEQHAKVTELADECAKASVEDQLVK